MIQPKLIEKYLQIEKQSYSRIQLVAKQTIEYIKKIIKPGMNLLEIRKFCEEKLLEVGADSFWYGMLVHLYLQEMKQLFLYLVSSM